VLRLDALMSRPNIADSAFEQSQGSGVPTLHACPHDPACAYCNGAEPHDGFDWSFVEAAYCISLLNRSDRAAAAAQEFHRLGLCRKVTFFRPERHPRKPTIGIWESHQAVAADALKRGLRTIAVFEDDVRFSRRARPDSVGAAGQVLAQLPRGWMIFYLGHWPVRAWFLRRNLMQTVSGCTHAYIASHDALLWLRDHPYGTAPLVPLIGTGIDSAYAALSATFAYFPMLALQRAVPSDHSARSRRIKRLRHFITRSRYREQFLSRLMRPNELLVAALSPLFYLLNRWQGGAPRAAEIGTHPVASVADETSSLPPTATCDTPPSSTSSAP
jgi:hypothetical protein